MSNTRTERQLAGQSAFYQLSRQSAEQLPNAELGDDVTVVTPDVNPPKHYFGARVGERYLLGPPCAKSSWACCSQLIFFCIANLNMSL